MEVDKKLTRDFIGLSEFIIQHIRRYWPVDNREVPKLTASILGTANEMRHVADVLEQAEKEQNRTDGYPGPVIELQLLELKSEWRQLSLSLGILSLGIRRGEST